MDYQNNLEHHQQALLDQSHEIEQEKQRKGRRYFGKIYECSECGVEIDDPEILSNIKKHCLSEDEVLCEVCFCNHVSKEKSK